MQEFHRSFVENIFFCSCSYCFCCSFCFSCFHCFTSLCLIRKIPALDASVSSFASAKGFFPQAFFPRKKGCSAVFCCKMTARKVPLLLQLLRELFPPGKCSLQGLRMLFPQLPETGFLPGMLWELKCSSFRC